MSELSDVEIRQLTGLVEFDEAAQLLDAIWGSEGEGAGGSRELLRVLQMYGGYVSGAFDDVGMVAASFALFQQPSDRAIHSYITGVEDRGRGKGIGFAIKLDQREWALARDLDVITWTFDPLVARNAHFNLVKLGADVTAYACDLYGPMADRLNGTDDSDRLLCNWRLRDLRVAQCCAGSPPPQTWDPDQVSVGLGRTSSGQPCLGPADAQLVSVAVPGDIESVRLTSPAEATDWRLAVREVLGGLLSAGGRIIGFTAGRGYVVDANPKPQSPVVRS